MPTFRLQNPYLVSISSGKRRSSLLPQITALGAAQCYRNYLECVRIVCSKLATKHLPSSRLTVLRAPAQTVGDGRTQSLQQQAENSNRKRQRAREKRNNASVKVGFVKSSPSGGAEASPELKLLQQTLMAAEVCVSPSLSGCGVRERAICSRPLICCGDVRDEQ